MTPLVRRYIKTSFVFLLWGLLLGGWIIVAEFVTGRYPPRLFTNMWRRGRMPPVASPR